MFAIKHARRAAIGTPLSSLLKIYLISEEYMFFQVQVYL